MKKLTPQKYIKTKVIEAHVLLTNPNRLMRFVFASDSIDSVILDLQEAYPNEKINRESVLSWEFLTVAKAKERGVFDLIKDRNNEISSGLFSKEQSVQVSDTTKADM